MTQSAKRHKRARSQVKVHSPVRQSTHAETQKRKRLPRMIDAERKTAVGILVSE
jgi:hypothetical protein